MQRTIVIGVGGTGLDVIKCIRRRIVETHGKLEAFDLLRFLYIDTDKSTVELNDDMRKQWEVLGQPTNLSPSEYAIVGVEDPGSVLRNLSQYKQIEPWFPAENLSGIDQTAKNNPGASQIRPLGRMAFTLNAGLIKDKFLAALQALPNPSGGGKTKVVMVCSLSGGTGSGMFLDLAYSLRKWEPNVETCAMLVLPSFTANRGERYLANAYAALQELNYFSVPSMKVNGKERPIKFQLPLEREGDANAPFDTCYLVSPRNSAPLTLTLDGLAEMVAHRLFLEFDGAAAGWVAGLMSNNRPERQLLLHDPFTGAVHSQNFCTFGLASIEYPIEKVTEVLSYQLVEDVVDGWIRPRLTPPNVPQLVKEDLPELWLTENHLIGNLDLFGGKNDYAGIDQEVWSFVNEARGRATPRRLAPTISERFNNFAKEFRTGGVVTFYQGLLDNAKGAVEVLTGRVKTKLNTFLLDPELGYDHAHAYLCEIITALEQTSAQFARELQTLQPFISNTAQTVNIALNQLNEADNRYLFRDSAVAEAMQRVGEAMATHLIAFTKSHAYSYASQLLSGLLDGLSFRGAHVSGLKDLRFEVEAWRQAMEKVRADIRTELASRREFLQKRIAASADFNGSLLFSATQIDSVYQQLDLSGARKYIREKALPSNNLLGLTTTASVVMMDAFRHALIWLDEISAVRIAEKNVADQLLEEYPASRRAERHRLLADNIKNAMAFLDFDQGEKAMAQHDRSVGYLDTEVKQATVAAMMSDDQNRFPNVALIRSEIEKEVGLRPAQIRQITDSHQILFLQERGAFPLRLIRDVRALKDQYERLLQHRSALPMHIQKSFDPPLMGLYITSDEERRGIEQREEDFLVGWVEGKLRLETNMDEERDEVRYRYRESGADKFYTLGSSRDGAFDYWMRADARLEHIYSKLSEDVSHLKDKMDTMAKRRDFSNRLAESLEKIKVEVRRGEEDPIYLRYSRIRERIFAGWKLPEPENGQ